jgi:hypothetical protein
MCRFSAHRKTVGSYYEDDVVPTFIFVEALNSAVLTFVVIVEKDE